MALERPPNAASPVGRYEFVTQEKASGATYTPPLLSNFVAQQIVRSFNFTNTASPVTVLDPAVGQGELLASLLAQIPQDQAVEVYGFDTDEFALGHTENRLRRAFPKAIVKLEVGDFLQFSLNVGTTSHGLFGSGPSASFDLVIANPPYVRTQIIGTAQSRKLARHFHLSGRVDLYYAFILGIATVLRPHGVAGVITSNRFMTTKSGAPVRRALRDQLNLRHIWDLGDTRLFSAAVLPVVILAEGKNGQVNEGPRFTSIYETKEAGETRIATVIDALPASGVVALDDGRSFKVQQGMLDNSDSSGIWRIATSEGDDWLRAVEKHTWRSFGQIGKVRVGVKTCADEIFIRKDWDELPVSEQPELLRIISTHHIARRYRALRQESPLRILYPHVSINEKRQVVRLEEHPRARAYLERHRDVLKGRTYVLEAGREWFEIWVPHDPLSWDQTKLVFRDISQSPCFWIDQDRSVVNGDCYWMICNRKEDEELLWLAAAVGNSTFIERYYDRRFNNKLYAGRRRFMTQYVEKFPLPDPETELGKEIIAEAKHLYRYCDSAEALHLERALDNKIWRAFGLPIEEVSR